MYFVFSLQQCQNVIVIKNFFVSYQNIASMTEKYALSSLEYGFIWFLLLLYC